MDQVQACWAKCWVESLGGFRASGQKHGGPQLSIYQYYPLINLWLIIMIWADWSLLDCSEERLMNDEFTEKPHRPWRLTNNQTGCRLQRKIQKQEENGEKFPTLRRISSHQISDDDHAPIDDIISNQTLFSPGFPPSAAPSWLICYYCWCRSLWEETCRTAWTGENTPQQIHTRHPRILLHWGRGTVQRSSAAAGNVWSMLLLKEDQPVSSLLCESLHVCFILV